ncbi:unnamed protein product [Allacma fusca]|uniref:Uncharacterized protein n=1 Tax=Allacma fusca TaxID=39272 RepID=A0A8J2PXI9_9HEXA|nr:unnamed protein product [Allacma fusca]
MRKLFSKNNLPGIPRAPVLNFMNEGQFHYEKAKEKFSRRLSLLTADDILRHRKPYIFLVKQLLSEGHSQIVEEILDVKTLEKEEVRECRRKKPIFVNDMRLLMRAVECFKSCFQEEKKGRYLQAANIRFDLAEELLRKEDLWLSRYFIMTAVHIAEEEISEESREFQAKMHCLLAYLGRNIYTSIQDQVQATIEHLEISRAQSRNKKWIFRVPLMQVSLRKPVDIYGLRNELEHFRCNSLPVYKLTTLIYFDILMQMVTHTIMSTRRAPTTDEYSIAFKLTREALALAREIRHPFAVMSALTEYGILLRTKQSFEEAIQVFQQLTHESMVHGDHDAQAIALGNIGACLHGQGIPDEALKWLVTQNELSHEKHLKELEADSIEKLGYILLEEGHVVEAEQAIYEAFLKYSASDLTQSSKPVVAPEDNPEEEENYFEETVPKTQFPDEPPHNVYQPLKTETLTDASWVYAGIAAGQSQWGRLAGLCRQSHSNSRALESVLDWKHHRCQMDPTPSPQPKPLQLQDVYEELNSENKNPQPESCDLACFKGGNKYLRKMTGLDSFTNSVTTKSSLSDDFPDRDRGRSVKLDTDLQVWTFLTDDPEASPRRTSYKMRSFNNNSNDNSYMPSVQAGSTDSLAFSLENKTVTTVTAPSQKRIQSYASSRAGYHDILIDETGSQVLTASKSAKDLRAARQSKVMEPETLTEITVKSITSKKLMIVEFGN